MKPPPFEYLKASSLEEALAALAADEDAHVLAGGQSLLPLLALRLARPSVLVDITGLGLDAVSVEPAAGPGSPGLLRLGALVRQRRLELDPVVRAACPLLADAARQVGYPATRNLGTIGGSLAHADPTAELPAVALALGGQVVASGPEGARRLACAELADGYFTTTLRQGEIITEVLVHVAPARNGAAWCEWSPRAHDFAEAGVGVALELDGAGTCVRVGAAACAVGGGPLDLGEVAAAAGLLGATSAAPALLRAVAAAVEAAAGAAGEERARLTGLLAAKAALLAFERAGTAALEIAS
jgi:carbon-monoxide dehydrogenase medium subunit